MRVYKMTDEQAHRLKAAHDTYVGPNTPADPTGSQLERFWQELGKELGFDPRTVNAHPTLGTNYFLAEPVEYRTVTCCRCHKRFEFGPDMSNATAVVCPHCKATLNICDDEPAEPV